MKYVVKTKFGWRDGQEFEFTDPLRANMFAEMAMKNAVPQTDHQGEALPLEVTITLIAEPEKDGEAETDTTEKEDE